MLIKWYFHILGKDTVQRPYLKFTPIQNVFMSAWIEMQNLESYGRNVFLVFKKDTV